MSSEARSSITVTITAIYGMPSRQPLVQVVVGAERLVMTPTQAQDIGGQLFEAAEAAMADGFLFEYVQRELGLGDQKAAALLGRYRAWRAARDEGDAPAGGDGAS